MTRGTDTPRTDAVYAAQNDASGSANEMVETLRAFARSEADQLLALCIERETLRAFARSEADQLLALCIERETLRAFARSEADQLLALCIERETLRAFARSEADQLLALCIERENVRLREALAVAVAALSDIARMDRLTAEPVTNSAPADDVAATINSLAALTVQS